MKLSSFLAASVVPLIAGAAFAAGVSLPASRDNTLFQDTTELSNGAGPHIFAGVTLFAGDRRGLVRFDLSAIPPGSTIVSVEPRMNVSLVIALSSDVELHRVTADWGESTSDSGTPGGRGAPAAPGDATWNYRTLNAQLWGTPGGDFAAPVSATATVTGTGPMSWTSSAGLVADVQGWLADPATNFGWILIGTSEAGSAVRFDSRENPDPALRPELVVEYTLTCAADFNQSGSISVQDIFDFLAAYFSSDPRADFNHSGSVSVQDIFDFLAAYFIGC